jgi:hypothetical protein
MRVGDPVRLNLLFCLAGLRGASLDLWAAPVQKREVVWLCTAANGVQWVMYRHNYCGYSECLRALLIALCKA